MKCGKEISLEESEYCPDCIATPHLFDRGAAVFQWSQKIQKSIYKFKYKDHKIYGEFYGNEMAEKYGELIKEWEIDVIMPVPIHSARKRKRGYNQAEIIGGALGKAVNIPMDIYALKRIINTVPQKKLGNSQRKKNVERAFKVTRNVVKYKKVLLVDDIYTTGSTVDACAGQLKAYGVDKVYFVTICIGYGI